MLTNPAGLLVHDRSLDATVILPADTPTGFSGLTLVQATGAAGSISVASVS